MTEKNVRELQRVFGYTIDGAGGNVTAGYYQNPTANAALHTADGWLRTGDLGTLIGGELFITGRAKEIIFVNGQNYYPHDLENIALRAPELELGKVVAAATRRNKAEAVMTQANLKAVKDIYDMMEFLGKHEPNDVVELGVLRDGAEVAFFPPVTGG